MKLYTRHGDTGQTGLFGGQRIDKDALRMEAIGAVDEFNAAVGVAACTCPDRAMRDQLQTLQARLFEIGADLASPTSQSDAIPRITADHVVDAEHQIDAIWAELPPMKTFILPGGSELAARLHLARAACRLAERRCVTLDKAEPLNPSICPYLNRLSDLLFAMARQANVMAGVDDVPWIARQMNDGAR